MIQLTNERPSVTNNTTSYGSMWDTICTDAPYNGENIGPVTIITYDTDTDEPFWQVFWYPNSNVNIDEEIITEDNAVPLAMGYVQTPTPTLSTIAAWIAEEINGKTNE